MNPNALPVELRLLSQWVCWTSEARNGKRTKVPLDPGGDGFASTADPETWATFEEALDQARHPEVAGIGFVFTTEDSYVGIDLDDCRESDSGELTEEAEGIVARFLRKGVVDHHEPVLRPAGFIVSLQFLQTVEIKLLLIPAVLAEELVHRPLALGRHYVARDAVDGLVGGGDQPGDVRFGVALLVRREAVEAVDGVGTGQKPGEWKHRPRPRPVSVAT